MNKYFDTAYELGLLKDIGGVEHNFDKVVTNKNLKKILENFAEQFPQLVQTNTIEEIPNNDGILIKREMAEYIVQFLEITPLDEKEAKRYFFDTAYHEHGETVEELAKRNIINHEHINFNIDSFASRADLSVMLANTFAYFNQFDLSLINTDNNQIIDIK